MPALVVSLLWLDLGGPESLVLSPMIVNWLLNPCASFELTFSTPDTFQVQILTKMYDKTRVNKRIKGESGFFSLPLGFLPFLKFCIVDGSVVIAIMKLLDW